MIKILAQMIFKYSGFKTFREEVAMKWVIKVAYR